MKRLSDAGEALLEADQRTADALRPHRQSAPVRLLDRVATLGDQPQMRILCAATIATGLFGGDRRLARAGFRMLAAHTLATWAKDAVKHRVDRTRPRSAAKRGKDPKPRLGRHDSKEENSFPSGHAAGAAAVGCALARDYRELALPAGAGAALLALAQIPRCAHYPTDIGAGIAIGLAAETVTDLAFRMAGVHSEA